MTFQLLFVQILEFESLCGQLNKLSTEIKNCLHTLNRRIVLAVVR